MPSKAQPNDSQLLLNTVPLLDAVLCADCEVISDSTGDCCSVCGSRSLLSIARILGGSAGAIRATLVGVDPVEIRNTFTVLVNPDATRLLQQRRQRRAVAHRDKTTG